MPATKSYHLHYAQLSLSSGVPEQVLSFVGAPYDALFTGLFLDELAAKRYLSLKPEIKPYRYGTLLCQQDA